VQNKQAHIWWLFEIRNSDVVQNLKMVLKYGVLKPLYITIVNMGKITNIYLKYG
jgi:hypothetical protein